MKETGGVLSMKPRIINVKGKPHLVVISYTEYQEYLNLKKKTGESPPPLPPVRKCKVVKEPAVLLQANMPEEVTRRLQKGDSPIRAWRLYRDKTQSELAAISGISNASISLIENNKRSATIDTLKAIACALKVPVDMLLA